MHSHFLKVSNSWIAHRRRYTLTFVGTGVPRSKETPTPLGPLKVLRDRATVESYGGAVSYERETPVHATPSTCQVQDPGQGGPPPLNVFHPGQSPCNDSRQVCSPTAAVTQQGRRERPRFSSDIEPQSTTSENPCDVGAHASASVRSALQGYLAHNKQPPFRTLQ